MSTPTCLKPKAAPPERRSAVRLGVRGRVMVRVRVRVRFRGGARCA